MISVCIATYNGGKYIRQQIESILPQLDATDEIIISDDGSTDDTLLQIEALSSSLVRVYKHTNRLGYTRNFERALTYAKGDVIFLCDQDDIWLPNKVEMCMKELTDSDLVVTNALIQLEDGKILPKTFFDKRKSYMSLIGNYIKFSYLGCCMCFKKNVLQKALPFPRNYSLCTHDNWIYLVGATFFRAVSLSEPCIIYRRHSSNASGGGFAKPTSLFFKISYRIYLIYNILKRLLRSS